MYSQGFCARNAACMYSLGLFILESIRTAVHGFTVTPVVSWPTESVIVFACVLVASITRSKLFFACASSSAARRPSPAASTTPYCSARKL